MKLLALSMLKQRWIQPILVWPDPKTGKYVIIDGFHRHMLTKTNKQVWAMTEGKVPCVLMEMSVPDRMLLTIRINRAKGHHAAVKMHEIVRSLVKDHDYSTRLVAEEIGADLDEVETLLMENVFEHKRVTEFAYTKAWYPPNVTVHGLDPVDGTEEEQPA